MLAVILDWLVHVVYKSNYASRPTSTSASSDSECMSCVMTKWGNPTTIWFVTEAVLIRATGWIFAK